MPDDSGTDAARNSTTELSAPKVPLSNSTTFCRTASGIRTENHQNLRSHPLPFAHGPEKDVLGTGGCKTNSFNPGVAQAHRRGRIEHHSFPASWSARIPARERTSAGFDLLVCHPRPLPTRLL